MGRDAPTSWQVSMHCLQAARMRGQAGVQASASAVVCCRDDPTILAWSLSNEPRCDGDYSGSSLQGWIDATAEFLKSIDPNHLITVGAEGFLGSSTPGQLQGGCVSGRVPVQHPGAAYAAC